MMEINFKDTIRFESDFYVGDYNEYARGHKDCHYSGVTISDTLLPDIQSLHFINKRHIPVLAINFEKNLGYFKDDKGKLVSNCECMLVSDKARRKGWLILAELKYCGGNPRTVNDNFENALAQVKATFLYLRDEKQLFGPGDYNYVWVISLPEHDDLIPFSQFYPSPERLLDYKEKLNVNLICSNVIDILTHQHVRNAL